MYAVEYEKSMERVYRAEVEVVCVFTGEGVTESARRSWPGDASHLFMPFWGRNRPPEASSWNMKFVTVEKRGEHRQHTAHRSLGYADLIPALTHG